MHVLLMSILVLFSCPKEKSMYKEAYAYLNTCEHLKELDKKICKNKSTIHFPINVISEVYPLSILIFEHEIIENSIIPNINTNQSDVNEFITMFDSEHNFEPFESNEIKELFAINEKSQIYVAFSKPIGNLLFAELAFNLHEKSEVKSIKELTRFNRSLALLFIFDENGQLIEVKKTLNQYD